jgi:hypothetical protein
MDCSSLQLGLIWDSKINSRFNQTLLSTLPWDDISRLSQIGDVVVVVVVAVVVVDAVVVLVIVFYLRR